MLYKTFLRLLLAPLLVLAAGCCANNPCDCNDSLADSLFFAFDPSFSNNELDTVYVARINKATGRAIDSLPLPRSTRIPRGLSAQVTFAKDTAGLRGLTIISNNAPFSVNGVSTNLAAYRYSISLRRDPTRPPGPAFYRFVVDSIALTGRYVADGCCTCYRNSQKQLLVKQLTTTNGVTVRRVILNGNVTDGNSGSAPRAPKIIALTKQ